MVKIKEVSLNIEIVIKKKTNIYHITIEINYTLQFFLELSTLLNISILVSKIWQMVKSQELCTV